MVNLTDFFKPADFLGIQITTLPPLDDQRQNTENECNRLPEKQGCSFIRGGGVRLLGIIGRCRPTADLLPTQLYAISDPYRPIWIHS